MIFNSERFWPKVTKTDYCWVWNAGIISSGYGIFYVYGVGQTTAHRAAWELVKGPIPKGLFVLHKCDNKICVRPSHLFLGTPQDNTDDMIRKGRHKIDPRRGVENGRAKLNPTLAKEIRQKYPGKGYSQERLAEEYGVSQKLISLVVNNKIW